MTKETAKTSATEVLPPPWILHGSGLILVLKKGSLPNAKWGFDDAIAGSLKTKTRLLMIVDYTQAPCGPYKELLVIPGTLDFDGKRLWSISDIWVTSHSSVDNGRRNWGIPKQIATFEGGGASGLTEEGVAFCVKDADGGVLLDISCQPLGPSLGFKSTWLPQSFMAMGQQLDGHRYFYSLTGNGKSRMAKVVAIRQAGGVFSGLHRSDVLAAIRVEPFEMVFPEPEVVALG